MWEGKLFSYILSSPTRAEKRGDDGARPPPQGIRGVPAWGARSGVPARGCAVGASAAPCSADFDPPRRTAPAGRGPRATLRPPLSPAPGWGGYADHRPRVTGGGGGRSRVRAYCSLALPLAVYVFSWEPSVWSGACIAGRGGEPRHPAPSRAQEGGREHPRRGRPPGPLRRPAVERARKLLSAARWTNFSRVLGLPFLLPSRPVAPSRGGGCGGGRLASRGRGPSCGGGAPGLGPVPPRPLPTRGLLGNCDLNGC